MNLNDQQSKVLAELLAFVDSDQTTFSLQGGAGVGKTYLVGVAIRELMARGHRCLLAAPTHKACRVLRQKLDSWGVPWVFKPRDSVPPGRAVVDTTAALLGVRPIIDDAQTEDELTFKATGNGSLGKLFEEGLEKGAPVLLVDEVSMLGRDDLLELAAFCRDARARLVCVGDEGQLPPVKKQAIQFQEDFDRHAQLDEVVRQKKGSSIVSLAWAVRRGDELENVDLLGGDVEKVDSVSAAYLSQLELPVDDEGKRSVYVAYRNAVVDALQEQACRKLYGHGRKDFRQGQLVLSTSAGYREELYFVNRSGFRQLSRWPKMEQVVANADQLRVVDIMPEAEQDPVYGRGVELDRVDLPAGAPNRRFETHYLSEDQLGDKAHPFNVKKQQLLEKAKELQQKLKEKYSAVVDSDRKDAWAAYFKHLQKVVGFQHPFAITSHKSQGSTYRAAFVNVADLLRFDRRALYVAVTRPSERLVL